MTTNEMESKHRLRVLFAPPGRFWKDARVEVFLDEHGIYDGGLKSGFDVTVETTPGPHVLRAVIHVGAFTRMKRYALDVASGDPSARAVMEVRLEYSRLWGNFASKLDVRLIEGDLPAAE